MPRSHYVADNRLDYALDDETTHLGLKPRWSREVSSGGTSSARTDLFFTQAFVRHRIGEGISVSAGRELLAWGPSNFRSPSNPYYFDAGKTRPLEEAPGVDVARATMVVGHLATSAGYVFGGRGQPASARHTPFIKMDYTGGSYVASAVLQRQVAGIYAGAYAQLTINDALLLYGETGLLPPARTPPAGATGRDQSWGVGATYSFEGGRSVALELLHDTRGYSRSEEQSFFEHLATLPAEQLASAVAGLPAQAPSLLGRNYVYVLAQSDLQDSTKYWRVSWTLNAGDRSSQLLTYGEVSVAPRLALFGSFLRNSGGKQTEFGAVVRQTFTVGAKVFFY